MDIKKKIKEKHKEEKYRKEKEEEGRKKRRDVKRKKGEDRNIGRRGQGTDIKHI